jgi:Ca2+-binding EF-hand superfamily protein
MEKMKSNFQMVFRLADKNRDGHVDRKELASIMRRYLMIYILGRDPF